MSEEIRGAIALVAGAIVLVLCYVKLFLRGRSFKQKFIEKAKAKGYFTKAALIDNKIRYGVSDSDNENFKNESMKCTYEYWVNGVSYKKKLTFHSPGLVAVKYPYSITVYYDPSNPSKSVCAEEASQGAQRTIGCLGMIVFAVITFIVIYNLLKLM